MSHISETVVRLDSREAIEKMCQILPEFTFHNRKSFKSYGKVMPPCEFCISIEGAKYEVGFITDGDRLVPQVDWWSTGGLGKALGGESMPKLLKAHNFAKLVLAAEREGHFTEGARLPDGKYKLFATKNRTRLAELRRKAAQAGERLEVNHV